MVVPNSCFSLIYASRQYRHLVQNKTKINVSLTEFGDDQVGSEFNGEWIPLNYTVEILNDNGTLSYKTITVKTFVTNHEIVIWHNGVVGMSPCPAGLEEYSFGY